MKLTPPDSDDQRAQSGIGTLIILIAAILVATIAAGVFFDITNLLSGQTSSTSEDVSDRIDGRLGIVSVSGQVSGETVDTVNVTVKLASDAGRVDLRVVTVQWIGPDRTATLTWAGGNETGPTFELTSYGTGPVLDESGDRATLTIDPASVGSTLETGDVVTITVVSRSEVIYRLRVPDSVSGESSVSL